ncbi:38152_t:CDS:2, partial [Gigaspora margarita]
RLVVDGSKNSGAGCFGFIDIFVNRMDKDGIKSSIILELKCISLVGLLSREKAKWVENADYKSLKALDDKIKEETEDELLNRKYFYWLQKGSINKYDELGIYDDRIQVMKGEGYLGGVLMVSLGSKCVLTRLMDNSFENGNVHDPAINQCIDTNTNLLEDKEIIDFLDEKNKEKIKRKLLRESDKDQFQDLFSDNYNISSDISCNTEITNEQDSLSVSHIISTNDLCKLKKEEALIQKISLEKNYTNKNLSSDREKKPRFQDYLQIIIHWKRIQRI